MSRRKSIEVSAIIPFYDTPEDFLREAVASVLEQTSVTMELLLVDDGSGSAISSVAMGLAAGSGGQVRYLTHPDGRNRGISATRNLGVAEAQGEYVAFLDSDDVWVPGKLSEQLDIFRQTPQADMVFGLSEYWYDWSPVSGPASTLIPDIGAKRCRLIQPPTFVSDFLRGRIIVPNPSNLMVRRSAYLDCGGFEESFPGMYEDQVFFAKLGLERGVCVVPRRWDKYRQHQRSVTAQARESSSEDAARRRFLLWLMDYCRSRGLDRPEIREAIAKELWLCKSSAKTRPDPAGRRSRWRRKWLLRMEELLIPARLRQRLWDRRTDL